MQRIRLTYSKGEELRYTGNLDTHKVWERTFRRAEFPLAYSQGFHPQPKLNQACPLPLGFTSGCEILDFWLDIDMPPDEIKQRLSDTLQPGIEILDLQEVALTLKPLQTRVISAVYSMSIPQELSRPEILARINHLLGMETCSRERRGKTYDLRPLIESIKVLENPDPMLEMRLMTRPGATGRPEEVLEELGISPVEVDITRSALILAEE
jgi:radical SAM-linked protein